MAMNRYGDWVIMMIAGLLLISWCYRVVYKWLHTPVNINRVKLGNGGAIADDDKNVSLLESNGYSVLSGKHVIPIPIELDDTPLGKGARMYIDYIAEKDELTYIVKTARDRMPMDWTASGVRDRLLVYALLLPDCAGVLFIDAPNKLIRKITFHIAE